MSDSSSPIRMLILHNTQNEAEPLINLFRNAGRATRSHFIASEQELAQELNSQTWDLILAKANTDTVNVASCMKQVTGQGLDIPIVLLTDGYNPDYYAKGIQLGAKDLVVETDGALVLHACLREISALNGRRKLKDNQIHLKESEKRVQLLLASSKDAIAYVHEGMHIYANEPYMEMFGYDDIDDLLCVPLVDIVESEKHAELKKCLKNYEDGSSSDLDCDAEKEDGSKVPVHMNFSAATYDGESCTQIVIRPKSENNAELEAKIQAISNTDLLTGLFNRQHFMEQLDKAYHRATSQNASSSIVYLQLQGFDDIRANYGIAGADIVLKETASVLKGFNKDGMTLAKISDDIFAFLIPSDNVEAVKAMAVKINKAIDDHLVEVDGKTVRVEDSIGIALVDAKCANANEPMGHAHQAAEQAMQQKTRVQYFDKNDLKNIADENLIGRVNHALENDGFSVMYQPIISLRGDTQEHYEVFLRLQDSSGNEIPPKEFISAAMAADMAGKIDRWIVGRTVAELAEHRKAGSNTQVVINLTPSSVGDPTFLPWVNAVLKEHKLKGDTLVFQITEKDAQNYLKAAKAFSKGLSVLKCKLSISHFGRVDTEFNLNKHLDIEYIKVHKSFVEAVEDSEEGTGKLESLIAQIHKYDIASVVPQVDSAAIMSLLWQAGANYIQGHLLQAPTSSMDYDFTEDSEEAV